MRNVLILASAAALAASVAMAEPAVTGDIKVEVNKDAEATVTLGAGLSAGEVAFGSFNVESVDGGTFKVDQWQLGTQVGQTTVSFGDQDGVFVESVSDDHGTLAKPAMAESLKVSSGDAQVALGFTDIKTDITEVSNVQGAYTVGAAGLYVTPSVDYNLNSKDYTIGGTVSGIEIAGINLGSALTWGSADEKVAYELTGGFNGISAYVNGDQDDTLQNVGAGYSRSISGITLGTDINYNVDTEEFTPKIGVTFSF